MHNKILLYDTFNARYLSYQEVAESFVSNEEFHKLTRDNSILLMGPRGCGKTTLLKMLTPAGLNFWNSGEANKVKQKMNFTAVYIPSDIQWKIQFEYLKEHLKKDEKLVKILTYFLFNSNLQIALCKSFNSIIGFGHHSEQEKIELEHKVCSSLIEVWDIGVNTFPTFDDLELKILQRIRSVNELVKRAIYFDNNKSIEPFLPNYIFDSFFDLVKLGCKVFETKLELDENHKWALCFDELEIVPKFIQFELLKFLRSVDQKFIFKLTTTPLFKTDGVAVNSSEKNDFNSIKLWVYDDNGLKRWRDFCLALMKSRFEKRYHFESRQINDLFGTYNLDEIIKDELNILPQKERTEISYTSKFNPGTGKNSSLYFLYKKLALKDPSFSVFLRKRGLKPKEPIPKDKTQEKSVFLKYKLDTVYRFIYKKRTRKKPPIHFGLPYLFDICDGNPRLVIGLIEEIIQNTKIDNNSDRSIPKNEQSNVVYHSSEQYFNLIKNHPESTIIVSNFEFNLATDLLDRIGKYFHDKIIQKEFSKHSPSTFVVDDSINAKFVSLLETALHLGAIVYLDPIESLSKTGIVGKRFRLSGFLTPKYQIPSRSFSRVNLSAILKLTSNSNQQTFFD